MPQFTAEEIMRLRENPIDLTNVVQPDIRARLMAEKRAREPWTEQDAAAMGGALRGAAHTGQGLVLGSVPWVGPALSAGGAFITDSLVSKLQELFPEQIGKPPASTFDSALTAAQMDAIGSGIGLGIRGAAKIPAFIGRKAYEHLPPEIRESLVTTALRAFSRNVPGAGQLPYGKGRNLEYYGTKLNSLIQKNIDEIEDVASTNKILKDDFDIQSRLYGKAFKDLEKSGVDPSKFEELLGPKPKLFQHEVPRKINVAKGDTVTNWDQHFKSPDTVKRIMGELDPGDQKIVRGAYIEWLLSKSRSGSLANPTGKLNTESIVNMLKSKDSPAKYIFDYNPKIVPALTEFFEEANRANPARESQHRFLTNFSGAGLVFSLAEKKFTGPFMASLGVGGAVKGMRLSTEEVIERFVLPHPERARRMIKTYARSDEGKFLRDTLLRSMKGAQGFLLLNSGAEVPIVIDDNGGIKPDPNAPDPLDEVMGAGKGFGFTNPAQKPAPQDDPLNEILGPRK